MQPRKAVRKYTDLTHVYCITSSASKESVVRVGLDETLEADNLVAFDIFESNEKILVIEPDPESPEHLFVIT